MENQKEPNFVVMTDEELMLLTGGDNFVPVGPEPSVDPGEIIIAPLYGVKPKPPILKYGIYPLYGIEPPIVKYGIYPLYGIKPIPET